MLNRAAGNLRQKLGRPLGRRWRRTLIITLIVVCVLVIFQIVAPFLISSAVVRERMERAVAQWTGQTVTIDGPPDIRFWPKPRITLRDVTIRKKIEGGAERVLGHMTRLSAGFDLLGALGGDPQFKDFRLTEPRIFVVRDASGKLDWSNDGLLSRAVRNATANGSTQVLDAPSDARVGNVRISNGSIEIADQADDRTIRIDGIDGDLNWPYLSKGASLQAKAKFRGQLLNVDFATQQPLLLLSGKSGDTAATIQSELLNGHFTGTINLASHGFLSGDTELSTPDFPALLKWSGHDLTAAAPLQAVSLQARLITNDDALRFENLVLGVNKVEATGILDLALPQGKRPRLTGTLATGSVDFSPVFTALAPSIIDGGIEAKQLRSGLELDIRLSTKRASMGPFDLDDVAIGIMNIGDQSRLDILDSDFESGRLTGRIATIKEGADGALGVRLSIHNADFASIIQRLALQGPLPAAPGSMDVALDVSRPLTTAAWRNAKGSVHFTAGPGVIPGVNLPAITQLSTQKPYFSLSEAGTGGFEFQSIDVTATLADGSAEIQQGKIVAANETMSLSGVVPYVNNSLALSSSIQATGTPSPAPSVFFIGGSWPNPVIWPLSQAAPKPAN